MNELNSKYTVVVTGDVTVDWHIASRQTTDAPAESWTADASTHVDSQAGGAALLAGLIAAAVERLRHQGVSDAAVHSPQVSAESIRPDDRRFHHSYAMWSADAKGVWRVNAFLGLDRADESAASNSPALREFADSTAAADLIVLDDADLGFRRHREFWPQALASADNRPWIILKSAQPVAHGPLWDELLKAHADRLIVVMTVDDLRRTEVQISRRLSWERTAQDVYWELAHNPHVNGLSRCAYTVISFGTAGAIVMSCGSAGSNDVHLCFDPEVMEGGWENGGHGSGHLVGNTITLTAAIAAQVIRCHEAPDIRAGIEAGVSGMRTLYHAGYGCSDAATSRMRIRYPRDVVIEDLTGEHSGLSCVPIQNPVRRLTGSAAEKRSPMISGCWTILQDRYPDTLERVAEPIVLNGLKASLKDVPLCKIGKLITVDRQEIEALRSIQSLIGEYCRVKQKKPLSIAVFGPPGSGKSFGVEQVADSVCPGEIKTLTFNLSQFGGPNELLGALHQVRDVGLSGKTPLVFWDEFDSTLNHQPLGWLRYFLAPMQDGTFQEGQITHPIGKCIFVFAGGTSSRMDAFGSGIQSDNERKEAKIPDFISRLKGYLNVLGPNRRAGADADPYFIIRRAILLRSLFERGAKSLFAAQDGQRRLNIDAGVLRALLSTREYKHGIRSMESIISMSTLAGATRFERSSLPSESQLDLHVNGDEFLSLVQHIVLTPELTERLAAAAHNVFCAGKRRDHWKFGEEKCEKKKTHPWLIDYEKLPDDAKEANRVTVRSIPRKLAAAGYVMLPARSDEPPLEFPGDDLEKLAEFEHELWMEAKLAAGFTPGKPTPDHSRRNEHLVPWDELDNAIKQIDRDLIKGIPQILDQAGYTLVKIKTAEQG